MQTTVSLRIQARIGHQLVMAGQLLQASGWEMEELLRQEVDENPALELVEWDSPISEYRKFTQHNHRSAEDLDSLDELLPERPTVIEQLVSQAALVVKREDQEVAYALLYSLDKYGYLREPLDRLAGWLGVERERLERVLSAVQTMDPPGIGARDLRECLLIQCAHLQAEGVDCALPMRILKDAWDEFAGKQWNLLPRKLGVSQACVEQALNFITRSLYPYPLLLLVDPVDQGAALTSPDLVIQRVEKGGRAVYHLSIPGEERYSLQVSRGFERVSEKEGEGSTVLTPGEREWVRERAEQARVFISAFEQRWKTLRRIGEFLINSQADFLEYGARHLKPVTQAAVAEVLGLHESTVSRAISSKTVQLPDGRIRPIRDLFDASLPVKEAMRDILSNPGRPLSDREIAKRLGMVGFIIARRTVAKYREQLHIPSLHTRGARKVTYEEVSRANHWD